MTEGSSAELPVHPVQSEVEPVVSILTIKAPTLAFRERLRAAQVRLALDTAFGAAKDVGLSSDGMLPRSG